MRTHRSQPPRVQARARRRTRRVIVLSSLAVAAAGTVGFVASSLAVGNEWLPNFVTSLPDTGPNAPAFQLQYADFIDFNAGDDLSDPTSAAALALDGKPMYRFSADIQNTGGPFQAFMGSTTPGAPPLINSTDSGGVSNAPIYQVIYDFGGPTNPPQANQMPVAGQNNVDAGGIQQMVGPSGPQTSNWQSDGHNHWHLQYMDAYRLLKNGVPVGHGNKAGFCIYDSHTLQPPLPLYYYPTDPTQENTTNDWCGHRLTPDGSGGVNDGTSARFVAWGLSPGDGSDLYPSNTAYQWIDTSAVQAGNYTVEATVNPFGTIRETTSSDNTATAQTTLPGPVAASASASTNPGQAVTVNVPAATIVAQGMLIRFGHECKTAGARVDVTCLQTYGQLGPGALSYQVVQGPGHGTLSGVPGKGPVTYTPAPGFTGTDTVVYKVTDTKFGFFSTGTISIAVGSPAPAGGSGGPSGPPSGQQQGEASPPPPPFATQFRRVVLRKGHDWRLTFDLNRRVDGTITIQHRVGRRWARLLPPRRFHGTKLTLRLTPRITWRTQYLRAYLKAGATQTWSRPVRVPKHLPRTR